MMIQNDTDVHQEKDGTDNSIEGTEDTRPEMQQALRKMELAIMTTREQNVAEQMTIQRQEGIGGIEQAPALHLKTGQIVKYRDKERDTLYPVKV